MQLPLGRFHLAGSRDVLTWATGLAAILAAGALVSVWRGRRHSVRVKLIWTGVALLVPVLGPLAWFALGRERREVRR
jgi:uncharacterized membrane protein